MESLNNFKMDDSINEIMRAIPSKGDIQILPGSIDFGANIEKHKSLISQLGKFEGRQVTDKKLSKQLKSVEEKLLKGERKLEKLIGKMDLLKQTLGNSSTGSEKDVKNLKNEVNSLVSKISGKISKLSELDGKIEKEIKNLLSLFPSARRKSDAG